MRVAVSAVSLLSLALVAGCHTKHEIIFEQPKPLEVNVNLSGRLELVVVDARQDLEQITGEKPRQIVSPADIGLPVPSANVQPALTQPTSMAPAFALPQQTQPTVVYLASYSPPMQFAAAADSPADQARDRMAQRAAEIRALWNSGAVGEAHTGLVVAKTTLTAAQQKLVSDENADRNVLYADEAKKKNTTVSEVALGYYVARLGYAQKGNWYEKFNKTSNQWEWLKWGE